MKKFLRLILISCCFLAACNKETITALPSPPKPLQIVISNITTTLTIYNFSVVNQSSEKLIEIYARTYNYTYNVNVKSGDVLQLHYFLELEGVPPPTDPVITFVYDGVPMARITNNEGIVSGEKTITIP